MTTLTQNFNLTKAEIAWINKFEKLMASAPKGITEKVDAYTIGDPFICIFHKETYNNSDASKDHNLDACCAIQECGAEITTVWTPFLVLSTAG